MTNKIQPTPGPWKAEKYCIWGGLNYQTYIAAMDTGAGHEDQEQANARLIAAAPELLAACKLALECGDEMKAEKAIRAAIAKTEGE